MNVGHLTPATERARRCEREAALGDHNLVSLGLEHPELLLRDERGDARQLDLDQISRSNALSYEDRLSLAGWTERPSNHGGLHQTKLGGEL